jgi:hypothetical protein
MQWRFLKIPDWPFLPGEPVEFTRDIFRNIGSYTPNYTRYAASQHE